MGALTAMKIKNASKPGKYGDGNGLYLNIAKGGSKSWIQRVVVAGKRKEIGLGGFPAVTLGKARELLADNRASVADGRDPVAERRKVAPAMPTFEQAARKVHKRNSAGYKSVKHSKNWFQMLEKYTLTCAESIGDLPIDQIDRIHVLNILTPIWTTKTETARRIRQRIREIFTWAMGHGYIDTNPAGDAIDGALGRQPNTKKHFRAVHHSELPAALETIRSSTASPSAKLALRFCALTAARSGECRGAVWAEIDWDKRLWTIPANRMKGKQGQEQEHRVPLSDAALDVLGEAWELRETGDYIFPSPMKARAGLSDMTLTKILRSTGLADRMTVHGLRSTFKDWAMEETGASWEASELALAHRVGSSVQQAYFRSDLQGQRKDLMAAWGEFLTAS